MEELKARLEVVAGKWKARAGQLEKECEAYDGVNTEAAVNALRSAKTRASIYLTCARELVKEAGLSIQL